MKRTEFVYSKGKNKYLYYDPAHPRANNSRYVYFSIIVAERAMGKHLPECAVVHHHDNVPFLDENLVICQDQAYHMFLHARTRAYKTTGDPKRRRCIYCKHWDDPQKMKKHNAFSYRHKKCHREYMRAWRSKQIPVAT